MAETVKKTIWLRGLVEDLDLHQGGTMMFCDSQSTIHVTKRKMYHEGTKNINVRYHFIREIKVIKIKKIGTADNTTDMMTKSVPSHKFEHCLNYLVFKMAKVEAIGAKKDNKVTKNA